MTQITASTNTSRWQEILGIWRDNRWLYLLAGILLGILVFPAIEQVTGDLSLLIGNLVPEAIGIIFTVLILDHLSENRNQETLKSRLFNEVRSSSIGQASAALGWLKRENWLKHDSLVGADLHRVNWEDVFVGDLNLEDANLNGANLKNVSNQFTDRDGIQHNQSVNLQSASLRYARLDNAVLVKANLSYAALHHAHLENAVLIGANLLGANLRYAQLDKIKWTDAILPNGIKWTSKFDMECFTNPNHREFANTLEQINTIRLESGQEAIRELP